MNILQYLQKCTPTYASRRDPPAAMEDILAWELEQVKMVRQLCSLYDWEVDDSNYKARIKLIQAQSVALQKQRLAATLGAPKVAPAAATCKVANGLQVERRPVPAGWRNMTGQPKKGRRCKGFESARNLLPSPPYGNWINDKESPSSKLWRRFISVDKRNKNNYARARIHKNKGFKILTKPPLHAHCCATDIRICCLYRFFRLVLHPGGGGNRN
jgi:hypothetical protein